MGWGSSSASQASGSGGNPKRRGSIEIEVPAGPPKPYTYLSTVLVAMNPIRVLPDPPTFGEYADQSFNPEKPHPYAIAEVKGCVAWDFLTTVLLVCCLGFIFL
jgi:hypothetical protein